jgi:hypothetical protein
MSHALRVMSVTLFVALACALTGGSAAATTMILEPAGEFTMVSSGAVTYSGEGIEFRCHLTISGEFERSIASIEREGGTLGQITEQAWSECTEAESIFALRLPWQMRIVRVLGTLPNAVTGILYAIATNTISFRIFGVLCLYVGAIGMLWPFRLGLVRNLGTSYTRFSGGFPCPPTLISSGEFRLSPTQTASFR